MKIYTEVWNPGADCGPCQDRCRAEGQQNFMYWGEVTPSSLLDKNSSGYVEGSAEICRRNRKRQPHHHAESGFRVSAGNCETDHVVVPK